MSARSSCQTPCCGRYLGARSPTDKQSQDYLWNGQESGPCHPSSDAGAGCSGKLGQSTLQKPIRFFVSARSISSSPVFCHVYSLPRMRDRDQVYGRALHTVREKPRTPLSDNRYMMHRSRWIGCCKLGARLASRQAPATLTRRSSVMSSREPGRQARKTVQPEDSTVRAGRSDPNSMRTPPRAVRPGSRHRAAPSSASTAAGRRRPTTVRIDGQLEA